MSEIKIFENSEFGRVRSLMINDEPYFIGKDVADILGYSNTRDAIYKHVHEEDKGVAKCDTLGGNQELTVINESGLYALIFGSKLPKAKEFKHWVTSEILPSIRKHGAYMTDSTLEKALLSPDFLIRLATQLKEEKALNSKLAVDNQIMKPKADYFDELVERNTLTNFTETAKQLGIQRKQLISFLMDKKYLYRDKKGKLLPYERKNKGYFEIKESFNNKTDWSGVQTLITPRGREAFKLMITG
ncbi:BRO family protein [Anaerofustis stercorihominis]|uniref:BRO family protein n=1 Tax=Anaerofustis stercorihominis TaxID=214853 RepID=UPI002671D31B|nr:BRO family protein [Anaerofustis stercorihominis]